MYILYVFFQHSKIRYRYIDINKCTSCMFFQQLKIGTYIGWQHTGTNTIQDLARFLTIPTLYWYVDRNKCKSCTGTFLKHSKICTATFENLHFWFKFGTSPLTKINLKLFNIVNKATINTSVGDPDPTALQVLIINQKWWIFHNIFST
jgi:hypothetical protein